MYDGQSDPDTGVGDFFSFGMRDSAAEFRFSMGSGPAIIRSHPLQLGVWHNVMFKRDRKDGELPCMGSTYVL